MPRSAVDIGALSSGAARLDDRGMRLVQSVLLLLSTLLFAAPAAGAKPQEPAVSEPTADARARAKELFARSAEHYRDGRFEQAVLLLQQAYELAAQPVLLYNLGRAYESNGQVAEAITAYEQYLRDEAEVADRGAIERRIATLRKQIAERRALAREADEARAERDRAAAEQLPEGAGPSPIPWIVAGVGVAGVAVGLAFGALAGSREGDADADPIHASASETLDDAETFATAANVSLIAGSAVAAIGLTWGIIDLVTSGQPDEEPGVEVSISPFGVALSGPLPW